MAKAELSEIKIDMNSVTTLKVFKRLVEKEETQMREKINLKGADQN